MTDFENKNTQPETEAQQPASPTPHLTLEPDPVPPEIPMPPEAAGDPFQMPDPPRAPEPPKQEPPQTGTGYQQPQYSAPQYGVPNYGQPQQTAAPQYNTPNYGQSVGQTYYNVPPAGYVQKSRLAAGLLAIMLGTLGIHNFYLGFNTRGVIQVLVSLLTCGFGAVAIAIWSFIEGILILSASSPARMYDGNGVILKD